MGVLLLVGSGLAVAAGAGLAAWALWPDGPTEGPELTPLAADDVTLEPLVSSEPPALAPAREVPGDVKPEVKSEPEKTAPSASSGVERPRSKPKVEAVPTAFEPVRAPEERFTRPAAPPDGGDSVVTVSSADKPFEPVILDGATFSTLRHVKRAVAFVNNATREELLGGGVHEKVVDTVLTNRPYASLQRFAYTKGIGEATMAAVSRHTSPEPP